MMTTAIALQRIEAAVLRDDLADRYIDFLNEAIKHFATRHSWIQMKTVVSLTLAAGARTAVLPPLFKEFQNGRYPVVASLPYGDESGSGESGEEDQQPIPVYSRQEIEHLPPSFRPNPHFIFYQEDGNWLLRFSMPWPVTLALQAYIYAFPDELVDDSGSGSGDAQSSPLLEQYPDAILEKALALAFQSISDPVWHDHDAQFEQVLPDAIAHDVSRSLPMGQAEKD